jgi:cellulose synthase/poly-beta-1,6-N-acetylglucosamine synthase-like glycosyltransferase
MSVPVSIIIPAFNQVDYCRQCLHTLLAHTPQPYRLILVDNGSTDGVAELFDSIPGAVVEHAPTNLGFAAGINLGMRHAEGHVLWLNSDTLLPRGWLEPMLSALERDPAIGMVGPRSNCVSGSQQIDGLAFENLEQIQEFADARAREERGVLRDVARLVGFCVFIRDSVWQELGGLDERYGIGNFEDDDYCMRVLRAGYRLCVAEDSFVYHYGSRTFLAMGITDDAWRTLIETNEALFAEKWRARPEERNDAVQQARQLLKQAAQAMEAGEPATALARCAEAAKTAPAFDQVYNDLGAVLWALGRQEEAVKQFERALRLNPGSEEARQNYRDACAVLHIPPQHEAAP